METTKLTRIQNQLVRQFYLQKSDVDLAKMVNSTADIIQRFRLKNNLKRNKYVQSKLDIPSKEIEAIEISDEIEVSKEKKPQKTEKNK